MSNNIFTQYEKTELISKLKEALKAVESLPAASGCYACISFKKNNACDLFGEVVPEDYREKGCDQFCDDIPF